MNDLLTVDMFFVFLRFVRDQEQNFDSENLASGSIADLLDQLGSNQIR